MESVSIKQEPPWNDSYGTSIGDNKVGTESETEGNYKWKSASGTNSLAEQTSNVSKVDADSETAAAEFRWQPLTGTDYSYVKFPYRQNIQQATSPGEVESEHCSGTEMAVDSPLQGEQGSGSQGKGCADQLISPSEIKQEPSSDDDQQEPSSEDDASHVSNMKVPPSKSNAFSPNTFTVRLFKSEPLDRSDESDKTETEAQQPATVGEGNKSVPQVEDGAKTGLWSGTIGVVPHMYGAPSTSDRSFAVSPATPQKTADQSAGSVKPTNVYYSQTSRTAPKGPTEERPYACEQCQASFTQAVYLKKHLKTHSGIKPWKCEQCGKTFIRRSQLSVHSRSHSGEKPYKCSHCDATFAQSGHLQVHTRTHTGEKPFRCEQCDSTFTTSSQLRTHVRSVHSNHRPFECLVCGMTFSSPANLRVHCRTHSGEKPYKCDKCDAAFTQSSNLKQHLLRHTGSMPFVCQFCGAKFARLGALQRHYEVHSEQEMPFLCLECDAAFPKLSLLQTHVKKAHGTEKTYSCEICSATFSQSWNLKRHKLTHSGLKPFQCFQCDAAFSQPSHLKQHLMRIHSEKRPTFDLSADDRVLSSIPVNKDVFPNPSVHEGVAVSSGRSHSHALSTDGTCNTTSHALNNDGARDTTSHTLNNTGGAMDITSHTHNTGGAKEAKFHIQKDDGVTDTASRHTHNNDGAMDTTSCTDNTGGTRETESRTHDTDGAMDLTDVKRSHNTGDDVVYPTAEQDRVCSDPQR